MCLPSSTYTTYTHLHYTTVYRVQLLLLLLHNIFSRYYILLFYTLEYFCDIINCIIRYSVVQRFEQSFIALAKTKQYISIIKILVKVISLWFFGRLLILSSVTYDHGYHWFLPAVCFCRYLLFY